MKKNMNKLIKEFLNKKNIFAVMGVSRNPELFFYSEQIF